MTTATPQRAEAALITFVDAATGERADLSAAELGGWAARVAGLLREGCGLTGGGRVAVLLPPHWLTAAVLLGGWSAGVALSLQGRATAGLSVAEPGAGDPYDASFVAADRIGSWLENIPAARHRFSLFAPKPPESYRDLLAELDEYSPHVPAYGRTRSTDAATPDGTSYGEWGAVAGELAGRIGLHPGDRLLVAAAEHEHPVKWLLAPLSARASVVVCANATPEALRTLGEAERVTHTLQ
ncbi:TIGR03089 family protein [Dactylosporangium sp. CA-233914]|uniref:TIGR03089 family protein n=1 Tax=Dactylosporangium sp. CA-233914 TaxID=3239934 RepID=UPI003D8A3873